MANNVYARLVYKQKPISHPDLNIFVAKLLSEQSLMAAWSAVKAIS
jgi:hypothetical protein